MSTRGSVTRLIIDLRSEEATVRELAARLFWGRYFQELLTLARGHLSARIRGREDEEDVLQSVYKSFCPRLTRSQQGTSNALPIDAGAGVFTNLKRKRRLLIHINGQSAFACASGL